MTIVRNGVEYELTGIELYEAHTEYERDCLIEDVKSKAEDMGIDLTGKDIDDIANRAERAIDNNDSLWDSYWRDIEYALENV